MSHLPRLTELEARAYDERDQMQTRAEAAETELAAARDELTQLRRQAATFRRLLDAAREWRHQFAPSGHRSINYPRRNALIDAIDALPNDDAPGVSVGRVARERSAAGSDRAVAGPGGEGPQSGTSEPAEGNLAGFADADWRELGRKVGEWAVLIEEARRQWQAGLVEGWLGAVERERTLQQLGEMQAQAEAARPGDEPDLDAIEREWLVECGPCDADVPGMCQCPEEDHRPVMVRLVARVRQLEAELAKADKLGEQAIAAEARAGRELESELETTRQQRDQAHAWNNDARRQLAQQDAELAGARAEAKQARAERDEACTELDTERRNGAADALRWAGRQFSGQVPHLPLWAEEIRSGARTIPTTTEEQP